MYSLRTLARAGLNAAKPALARPAAKSFARAPTPFSTPALRAFSSSRLAQDEKVPGAADVNRPRPEDDMAISHEEQAKEAAVDAAVGQQAAPEYVDESARVTAESAEAQETKAKFVEDAAQAAVSPVVDPNHVDPAAVEAAAADLQARTVFVGGISWNLDNEWLKDEVLKGLEVQDGVNGVRIARNPMGKSKGFAFIELATPELAQKLTELALEIDGRQPEFRLSSSRVGQPPRHPREPRAPRDRPIEPRNPPTNTVWAGNVAWSVTEAELEHKFAQFGQIKRVSLPLDSETGRSRGIGYVEFEAQAAAQKAVEAGYKGEGIELGGRSVRLDFAADKSRGASRGGFGNRGGRGGYGQQRRGDVRQNGRRQRGSEW